MKKLKRLYKEVSEESKLIIKDVKSKTKEKITYNLVENQIKL